jgi:hypothetical protein
MLFGEPDQPRTRWLGRVEPKVHWLTESTRPEAQEARLVVNRWYEAFPDPAGVFAAKLRSDEDAAHFQALGELHLHHLLRERHADVRYEEDGHGPDFRIYVGGTCIGAIEMVSLFQRQDWSAEQLRYGRLADELDRRVRPTAGYFANFQIKRAERDPSPRRFAQFVRDRIAELPPHDQAPPSITQQRFDYEEDGVRIEVRFGPMKADARSLTDPDARISGIGQVVGGFVNSASRLRARLAEKASSKQRELYGVDGLPFLVAVGVHDICCSTDEVIDALYGSLAVVVGTGEGVRQQDGFFGVDREHRDGRRRAVSGVAVVAGSPYGPGPAEVTLFHNPFASHVWPPGLLSVARSWGVVERSEGSMRLDWTNGA